jgi:hypothetical protein
MENRLDELFKNKLAHHATHPSEGAWGKLRAGLGKKNRPVIIVWRIAAALLLMGCLIAALYQMQTPSGQIKKEVAQKKEIKANPSPAIAKIESKQVEKTISKSLKKKLKPIVRTSFAPVIKEEIRSIEVAEVEKDNERSINNVVLPLQVDTKAPIVANVEKPIVLEFTLVPIETEAVATLGAEKKRLKKFFEKAKDLKNGEGGIDLADFTSKLFAANNKPAKNKESIN